MRVSGRMLFVLMVALASLGAMSQERADQSTVDNEIRIGNVMPYSGPLSEFGAIGQAEAAYFDMVNARGGINGRKIRFITRDDNSDPATALELTRNLVETDDVHLMFGSFGTPGNLATRWYLNEKKIPQLFVASGDEELSQAKAFPWTMGWQPPFRSEGRIYANYIQAYYPRKKIVVLWQNDQFGRSLLKGIEEGLGDLNRLILVDIAFDIADEHLDGHVSILKRAGADVFVFLGVPSTASKVIKLAGVTEMAPGLHRQRRLRLDRQRDGARGPGEFGRRDLGGLSERSKRSRVERRSCHEGLVRLYGQVPSRRKHQQQRGALWLRRGRDTDAGAEAMRRRLLAREHHASGSFAQELSAFRRAAQHQDEHLAEQLSADQADAAGPVRRPVLATVRRGDRNRIHGRCGAVGATSVYCGRSKRLFVSWRMFKIGIDLHSLRPEILQMTETIRIKRFNARPVIVPMNLPLKTSTGAVAKAPLVLIDCETDQGVRGHAYLFSITPSALKPLTAMVTEMSDLVAGDELLPFEIERKLTQRFTLLGLAGLQRMAQSGIDMAAWDALARARSLPLARLLGGAPKPVRAYNSKGLGIMPAGAAVEEAHKLLAEGFQAAKIRVGRPDAREDLKVVRAVREAVGDDVTLMCDYNQALTVTEAIRRGEMLDDEGLTWIEEPIRHDDYSGCARIADALRTPVQIGENFDSAFAMQSALSAEACDYVMPDVQRIGGVTGWLRAAALAHAAGSEMSTHLFSEVSAHLLCVTPTAHWLEYVDWADAVLATRLQIKDGFALPSEESGNGIAWDEAAVRKYLID
ncbi:L-alanine-DL-glutamate epimerase-like enolase superfamily enzyme [Bradyrhizobium sp. LB13.1]